MQLEVGGKRKKGRPRKLWEECWKSNLWRFGLKQENRKLEKIVSRLKQELPSPVYRDSSIKVDAVLVFVGIASLDPLALSGVFNDIL